MWLHIAKHAASAASFVVPFVFICCYEWDKPFSVRKFYSILGIAATIGALEGIATIPEA